ISSNWYAEPTISNCTIVGNQVIGVRAVGGGVYSSYGSQVDLIDSIIWNNVSSYDGAQLAVGSGDPAYPLPAVLNVAYSDVQLELDPNDVPSALDLVFCIDSTSSMADDISAVQAPMTSVRSRLRHWG
ncbi:MAG: hypothetical protein ACYS21_20720, partial [Planctomycetota bacterium]